MSERCSLTPPTITTKPDDISIFRFISFFEITAAEVGEVKVRHPAKHQKCGVKFCVLRFKVDLNLLQSTL